MECTFTRWLELADALLRANHDGWIFRGQPSDEYPLTTKLERDLSGIPRGDWIHRENSLVAHFKDRVTAHLPTVPRHDDVLGWLALMQH